MPERTRVSVLLTSYNHEKYLKEAIESVLDQSFSDFELIIWDDASTDESWQVIAGYSDNRIKPFRNDLHKRALWGMNKAISEIAAGEYIAVHHSDDIWEPQKLEKQAAVLDSHPEVAAVFSNALIITESGELLKNRKNVYFNIFDQPNRTRYEWLNHFFCRGNVLCHPSVLIRKSWFRGRQPYRSGLGLLADLDLWVRICLENEIYVLPEKLVRYRVRANRTNASTDPSMRIRRPFEFLQVLNNYKMIETPEELVKVFPTAEKYTNVRSCDLDFALGMTALELKPHKVTELFGLNLLFEALNDPGRAQAIESTYGFANKDFVPLTVKHDVFSVELLAKQSARLEELSQRQAEIVNSRAWKFLMTLRRLFAFFFPPGSRREKMARYLLQPVLPYSPGPTSQMQPGESNGQVIVEQTHDK